MKVVSYLPEGRGPFRADQIRPGDPYELSDGHAIVKEPSGRRHGRNHLVGGAVLATDPAVEDVGVEIGHVLDAWTLRAPDVSVGGVSDDAGFAQTAPALAVEYVEAGANERALERKIEELLGAGTAMVWVVRIGAARQVEVHRGDGGVDVKHPGETVEAPGILKNAVPVDALYDRAAAHDFMLRNLLGRAGYTDLDAVRAEGHADGEQRGRIAQARSILRRVFASRGEVLDARQVAMLDACDDLALLDRWTDQALGGTSAADVLPAR